MTTPISVLIVIAEPPLVEGGAEGRCLLGRVRGLESHGVRVRVLAARQPFSIAGTPPPDLDVEVLDVAPPPPGWRARADRLRRPRGHLGTGEFAARVRELARDVDLVHLEGIDTAWCDAAIRTPSLMQLNFLVRGDRRRSWRWNREARDFAELALAESSARRRHRWLAANSEPVARVLRGRDANRHVVIAPLSLDPRYYPPAPLTGPPVAGLIGTATWPTTAASIRRLLTRVWPRVLTQMPSARLRLAGRGVRALVGSASIDGVDVVGETASAIDFIRDLSTLVYPIERGTGMKVKTLESLALGVPIVTTSAGAEGLASSEGIAIEHDDAALAKRTVELLRDATLRRTRGHAARLTFERHHAPEHAAAPLAAAYRRIAADTS